MNDKCEAVTSASTCASALENQWDGGVTDADLLRFADVSDAMNVAEQHSAQACCADEQTSSETESCDVTHRDDAITVTWPTDLRCADDVSDAEVLEAVLKMESNFNN